MWNVGWFLLRMFVDLLRVCSLYIIGRKHFSMFLMINLRKQKTCFNNDPNYEAPFSINSVQSIYHFVCCKLSKFCLHYGYLKHFLIFTFIVNFE